VISLADEGAYGESLRALGVSVHCCRMRSASGLLPGFVRLLRFLRHSRADVVQTWMYHADLLGGLAARLLGFRVLLWGIRNFRFTAGRASWSARFASRVAALLSRRVPLAIVSCSAQSAIEHRRRGYAGDKIIVIPNGCDCERLHIDRPSGEALRREWGVAPGELLIGMVARWDPLKDHDTLFVALRQLARHRRVRCALIGPGMDGSNRPLGELLDRYALRSQVLLAGCREDIAAVMNALDLHVLSSSSEAFPNVVAEAMACGTPCVVTDVGDAAAIVGETGWSVPPREPQALSAAIESALSRLAGGEAESLRAACRRRIVDNFSREKMAQAYENVWSRALASAAA
jgi:glycosyltransferase involved in cell wall biosynthesis